MDRFLRALALACALSARLVVAADAVSSGAAPAEPKIERIDVGRYLNQINSIDLKGNSFAVDFWIWFRWSDPTMKPIDTFEVIAGRITSKTNFVRKDLEGGVKYAACRVTAVVTKYWDLTRFPSTTTR